MLIKLTSESEHRLRNFLFRYLLLAILCMTLGLIDGLRSYTSAYSRGRYSIDLGTALHWDLVGWAIWILFIPLVFRLSRRFPIDRSNWLKRLLYFLPAGILIALLRTVFPVLVYLTFFQTANEIGQWLPDKFYILITDYLIAFAFYAFVLCFGQTINYYKRYRAEEILTSQLESQLSKAQLQALKMQLHPHFLFNALNSISALQMENTEAAQEMTARLGDFLRMTLDNVGAQEVTLEREIEFLKCYLDIEKVRFGHRLMTSIEVEPAVLNYPIPNLILQPLVENAIRHGFAPQTFEGRINIKAGAENGWIKIEVEDNGKGIDNDKLDTVLTSGIGLSNTRERLERSYGTNFRFQLQSASSTGTGLLVTLRLPRKRPRGSEEAFS